MTWALFNELYVYFTFKPSKEESAVTNKNTLKYKYFINTTQKYEVFLWLDGKDNINLTGSVPLEFTLDSTLES